MESKKIIIKKSAQGRDIVPKIEIRKTVKNDLLHKDVAFITRLYRENGKKVSSDNANLSSDENIRGIIMADDTRVILADGEYIGVTYLDEIKYTESGDIYVANINGMFNLYVNPFTTNPKKTKKYYTLFKKHKIFDIILLEYFKAYEMTTINAVVPEWLEERIIKTDKHDYIRRKTVLATMLNEYGFRRCKDPIRNMVLRNGKSRAVFVYQLHRKWFMKTRGIAGE